mmetsp:Transcript_15379/g.35345  ORF Transcript_15379/g.35345 Transcript_15379/m.35345 type:complete len:235 (+) Transcript_15379:41-745(+)|eukprot:CAMPEP_0116841684 /NCGR_PEP_ID=MMETSP0418-20121206/11081_1 /TAXON_ID=1158023 /ORGANISM="Astrosyne radiata, Strain 13vi08-1A" /LENGTH=234 /DNA_ID=CAMNT_0004472177 /DNA_START=35 /DNA_END=739 /DNA_ORIENTATION=-
MMGCRSLVLIAATALSIHAFTLPNTFNAKERASKTKVGVYIEVDIDEGDDFEWAFMELNKETFEIGHLYEAQWRSYFENSIEKKKRKRKQNRMKRMAEQKTAREVDQKFREFERQLYPDLPEGVDPIAAAAGRPDPLIPPDLFANLQAAGIDTENPPPPDKIKEIMSELYGEEEDEDDYYEDYELDEDGEPIIPYDDGEEYVDGTGKYGDDEYDDDEYEGDDDGEYEEGDDDEE